jgi:hypothetical protein
MYRPPGLIAKKVLKNHITGVFFHKTASLLSIQDYVKVSGSDHQPPEDRSPDEPLPTRKIGGDHLNVSWQRSPDKMRG